MKENFYAIVDIGSNSALLVITECVEGQLVNKIQKMASVRLGEDLSADGDRIGEVALSRLDEALRKYAQTLHNTDVELAQVFLTEAVRRSGNPEEVYDIVEKRLGKKPETLSGELEGYFAWLAVAHHYKKPQLVALDIGAGSSELALNKEVLSLPYGALRLTREEGSFPGEAVAKRIAKELKEQNLKKFQKKDLVISGGTASAVVMSILKISEFDEHQIEGYELSEQALADFISLIMGLSAEVLTQMPGLDGRRGEIFVAGLRILQAYIQVLKPLSIRVSTLGVRRGALVHQLGLFDAEIHAAQ